MKKEELIKKNERLESDLDIWKSDDRRLRKEFTDLLLHKVHSLYHTTDNSPMAWEEIFFRIGELNADANYAMLIQNKQILEEELHKLREKIKNPKEKK